MTDALPLFTWTPAARRTDPDTSQRAAAQHQNIRAKDRMAVLAVHREHHRGLTDFELADIIGRQQTSMGKRRGELRDAGLICDSGERRASPSGSSAIVWRITDPGKKLAESLS